MNTLPYPNQSFILQEYSTLKSSLEEKMKEIARIRAELDIALQEAKYLELDLMNKTYLMNLAKTQTKRLNQ